MTRKPFVLPIYWINFINVEKITINVQYRINKLRVRTVSAEKVSQFIPNFEKVHKPEKLQLLMFLVVETAKDNNNLIGIFFFHKFRPTLCRGKYNSTVVDNKRIDKGL